MDGSNSDSLITYQSYTTQNEFLPLLLSFLTPDLDIPIVKKIFSESLGINEIPFVYINSPIHNTLERFKEETGNKNREQEYLENGSGFSYVIRENNADLTSSGQVQGFGDELNITKNDNIVQSDESFERDKLFKGFLQGEEDYFSTFYFAPVLAPLSLNTDDGEYTSLVEFPAESQSAGVNGIIFQYPKLADIQSEIIKDELPDFLGKDISIDDSWIREIIRENPEHRGILAFSYPYADGFIDYFSDCGSEQFYVQRLTPSLYIKFVDIKNDTGSSITLESIGYKSLDKGIYELTEADQRNFLFKDVPESIDKINISLEPDKHLIIPIEFGFNTDAQKSVLFRVADNFNQQELPTTKKCYVGKPISSREMSDSGLNIKLNNATSSDQEKTEILMTETYLDQAFLQDLSSPDQILKKIPTRIAIGSLINVESLVVDGSRTSIQPPNDSPTVYVSKFFMAGSCPYLKVYDSRNDSWIERGTVLYMRNNKECISVL